MCSVQKSKNKKKTTDCTLYMKGTIGNVDYTALPEQQYEKCIIFFPSREPINSESPGLLIEIKRLNIPCDSGSYIRLSNHDKLWYVKIQILLSLSLSLSLNK